MVPEFSYYESVLSNVITASMVVSETGFEAKKNETIASRGLLDGLPVRGGERVDIELTDFNDNTLKFSQGLYVNRSKECFNLGLKVILTLLTYVQKNTLLLMNRPEWSRDMKVRYLIMYLLSSRMS